MLGVSRDPSDDASACRLLWRLRTIRNASRTASGKAVSPAHFPPAISHPAGLSGQAVVYDYSALE